MSTYDTLSESYDAGRLGYSNEVYTTLVSFGLQPSHKILDVACGTGLASGPFVENNYDVTGVDVAEPMLAHARMRFPEGRFVQAAAEKLPFDAESFDVALSAQAFHHLDRAAAIREMLRVLRPNGIIAIWWKHLLNDDAVKLLREELIRELGAEPPVSGLKGGFREFYGAPLREHSLRVIPWRSSIPLSKYMKYECSRKSIVDVLGSKAERYYSELENRLHEKFGDGDPFLTLTYTHYLYLGKK